MTSDDVATQDGIEDDGEDRGTEGPAPEAFDTVDVIRTKRDGARLTPEQIDWVIDAYTRGVVAEEQMAALAMAI